MTELILKMPIKCYVGEISNCAPSDTVHSPLYGNLNQGFCPKNNSV